MPSELGVKTASARNLLVFALSKHKQLLWFGGIAAAVLVLLCALLVLVPPRYELRANGHTFTLIAAITPAARAKGLGERTSLPADQGMLFVFPKSQVQCFWMKDMYFSLDMIWIGADKQVEYVQPNVSPATYPHVLCPQVLARYVIELRAGAAKAAGLQAGEALQF